MQSYCFMKASSKVVKEWANNNTDRECSQQAKIRYRGILNTFQHRPRASADKIMNLDQLLNKELKEFEERIVQFLSELGIQEKVESLFVDHLALRIKDTNDILSLKNELKSKAKVISSAIVNGREILIYKLNNPLQLRNWFVPCIELPYPKPDHSYPDGWEHIEIVFPSSATTIEALRTDFQNYFSEMSIDVLKSIGQYSEEIPQTENEQLPNPSIILRKNKNTAIKFHARTIEEVVA